MSPFHRYKHDIALLVVVVIWGVNFPVIKAALEVMHLHVINAFRFTMSALLLGGIYYLQRRDEATSWWTPMKGNVLPIATLGLLGYFFYQLAFIVGVDNTTAGNAALIMTASPLFTALIGRLLKTEHLGRWAWYGLFISLIGTILVVLAGSDRVGAQAGSLYGNILMLLAALLWGSYTGLNRLLLDKIRPIELSFLGLLFALPFLYGIAIPHFSSVEWSGVTIWIWTAIFFSGGLSVGLAVVIWNSAVKHVGASNTAVYNNLVPFVAVIGGVTFLGEPLTWMQIVGGALIIGGLVVLRRDKSPRSLPRKTAG